MTELRRLAGHRYVGARDTMMVYDTENHDQRSELSGRLAEDDLIGRDLVQTFGPDSVAEARNRGFRAAAVR